MGLIMKKDRKDWDEQLKKALTEDGGKTEDEAADMVNNKQKYLSEIQSTVEKPKLATTPDEAAAESVRQANAMNNYLANGGDSTLTDKQKTVLTTGQSTEKKNAIQNALNNANVVDLVKAAYSGSLRRSPLSGTASSSGSISSGSTSSSGTKVSTPTYYGTGTTWGSKRNTGDPIADAEKKTDTTVTVPTVSKKTDGISASDIGLGESAKKEESSGGTTDDTGGIKLPSDVDAEELFKQFFNQYFGSESYTPSGAPEQQYYQGSTAPEYTQYQGTSAPEQQYYQGTTAPEYTQYTWKDENPYEGLTEDEKQEIVNQLQQQASQTTEDVMGKYASMTGGVPSTSAVSQAAASGSDVMSKLYDLLEAKEESKYNRWKNEESDAYSRWLNDQNMQYSRWQDQDTTNYNRWLNDQNTAYDRWQDQDTANYNRWLNDQNLQYSRWQDQDTTDYNRWLNDQNTAYDRWQDQEKLASTKAESDQNDAYNKLSALMGLYGYGNSSSGTSSSSSSSASYPDTTLGSISSATGVSADSIPSYSTWIKNYGSKLAADTIDQKTGETKSAAEALASQGVKKLMEDLEENYPEDFIYRAAAIIDYMYENAAITGAEREQWLLQSGLKALADKMSGGSSN